MRFKEGVGLGTVEVSLMHGLLMADLVWHDVVGHEVMITSLNDGQHMLGSKHYEDLGADFRIYRDNDPAQGVYDEATLRALHSNLVAMLGTAFDVVLEDDHIHMEVDPA